MTTWAYLVPHGAPPNPHRYWDQNGVNIRMRWVLFDWLLDLTSRRAMNMHYSCLLLAFSIVDRYMDHIYPHAAREQLQLLGVSALYIAAKLCDARWPDAEQLLYYTDNVGEHRDLMSMERRILNALGMDLLHAQGDCPQPHAGIHYTRSMQCAMELCWCAVDMAHYTLWQVEAGVRGYLYSTGEDCEELRSVIRVMRAEIERRDSGVQTAAVRKFGESVYSAVLDMMPLALRMASSRTIMTRSRSRNLAALDDFEEEEPSPVRKRQRVSPPNLITPPPKTRTRCNGETKAGARCKRWARRGTNYCFKHGK